NAGMRSQIGGLEAQRRDLVERQRALQAQLTEQGRPALPKQLGSPIATLILLPGLSRSDNRVPQLALNPAPQIPHFEIQLEPRDEFPHFRAELRTRRGGEVLSRGNLARTRTGGAYTVAFDLPASALVPGDYELALKGINGNQPAQDIGFYYFSV